MDIQRGTGSERGLRRKSLRDWTARRSIGLWGAFVVDASERRDRFCIRIVRWPNAPLLWGCDDLLDNVHWFRLRIDRVLSLHSLHRIRFVLVEMLACRWDRILGSAEGVSIALLNTIDADILQNNGLLIFIVIAATPWRDGISLGIYWFETLCVVKMIMVVNAWWMECRLAFRVASGAWI